MSEPRAAYVTTQTQTVEDVLASLTNEQRQLLLDLASVDFFRFNRPRDALIKWDGRKLRVFDTEQIRGYT